MTVNANPVPEPADMTSAGDRHRRDDWEEVTQCAACGESRRTAHHRDGPFSYWRCARCTLVYVTPRLRETAISQVYGDGYWRSSEPRNRGYANYMEEEPRYLKTFELRLSGLERFLPNRGSALDIGCAAGYFLKVLRDRGWDVYGVDISEQAARVARDEHGLDNVVFGDAAIDHWRTRKFDLVALWDVLEHVHDPAGLLRRARELLRNEGVLLIETQNVDSMMARLLGRKWHHFKHEEHLYHFNARSLNLLFRQCGLTPYFRTSRYAGKYVSFSFIRERALRLGRPAQALFRWLAPLDDATVYINCFDEMIVLCRPTGASRSQADGNP